jgi:RNA-binding protein YhbY
MSESKKKNTTKKQSAKKSSAKKAPAKKQSAKKAPAKKQAAKKAPAKKAAAAKKTKQTVESACEAITYIEAHENMHKEIMEALNAADAVKIDFLDDTRDTIVEWAKDFVEEESEGILSVKNDKIEIDLNAKNGLLKRFFSKLFKR